MPSTDKSSPSFSSSRHTTQTSGPSLPGRPKKRFPELHPILASLCRGGGGWGSGEWAASSPPPPGWRLSPFPHRAVAGRDHFNRSDRKESSTAGSASIRSPSSMSRARGSILSGSSREKGSISKPGTWDRALAISLDRPGGESPAGGEDGGDWLKLRRETPRLLHVLNSDKFTDPLLFNDSHLIFTSSNISERFSTRFKGTYRRFFSFFSTCLSPEFVSLLLSRVTFRFLY